MNAMPDVFILGAQKAGTTWLAATLAQHSAIGIGKKKEAHFFDQQVNTPDAFAYYADHFEPTTAPILLDATPNYLCDSSAPALVLSCCPNAKFIVILRRPADRIRSALSHHVARRRLPVGVHQTDYVSQLIDGEPDPWSVLAFTDYARGLRRWLDHFPAERFCFLIFEEDILGDPNVGLARALGHLNLDEIRAFQHRGFSRNASPQRHSTMLLARYLPFGHRLAGAIDERLPNTQPELRDRERIDGHFSADIPFIENVTTRSLAAWTR